MKKQKLNTKHNKGITLIALIITIVILLILAVVSIGAIRESKIVGYSKKASSDYTMAQEKEQLQLALSEWKIQKNTQGNTTTFSEVVTSALGENATVSGSGNKLTVKFKTGNIYKISSQDDTIGEAAKLTGTAFEKYIFGDDLQGRDLAEIYDSGEFIGDDFYNEEWLPITDNFEENIGDSEELHVIYFEYNEETYKFKYVLSNSTDSITEPYYGLTKIEIDTENTRVGKTVWYDNRKWTILYDDETNGLQMTSTSSLYGYNEDIFKLGYEDSLITDWSKINTKTNEFKLADLNGNNELDSDAEKGIYSYNTAIQTLNTACKSVVPANDNIIDVRCAGTNPINKNAENTTPYTSDKLAKLPENSTDYEAGILNGKGKGEDLNYVSDLDRIIALEITYIDNTWLGENNMIYYWLGSRCVSNNLNTNTVGLGIRYVISGGETKNSSIFGATKKKVFANFSRYTGLRPVVTIKSDDGVLTEAGEGISADYVLN